MTDALQEICFGFHQGLEGHKLIINMEQDSITHKPTLKPTSAKVWGKQWFMQGMLLVVATHHQPAYCMS